MFTQATPELILEAYAQGIFPMAETATSAYFDFYRPTLRGQLSIENIHIPKRLLKTIKQAPYEITINQDFVGVIEGCATINQDRDETWINPLIRDVFIELHGMGHTHSVEVWQGDTLVGGLYGLALGRVFCGESMFSCADDASKIALIHLVARLWRGGFKILDTQFTNPHLEQFGIYEIPQEEYEQNIKTEMLQPADFHLPHISEQQIMDEYLTFRNQESISG